MMELRSAVFFPIVGLPRRPINGCFRSWCYRLELRTRRGSWMPVNTFRAQAKVVAGFSVVDKRGVVVLRSRPRDRKPARLRAFDARAAADFDDFVAADEQRAALVAEACSRQLRASGAQLLGPTSFTPAPRPKYWEHGGHRLLTRDRVWGAG